jgi:3-deoxy-D-manno-octulosonate 8-phosphate phosphatase (KDO 8-P phosphatase)
LSGLKIGIITGKMSPIVERRARELGIEEFHQGYFNKVEVYKEIRNRQGLFDAEIAYIGDDLFDLGVLKLVGFAACPADAVPEVKDVVHYVAKCPGGRGAVREIIELVLKARHKWEGLLDKFLEGKSLN